MSKKNKSQVGFESPDPTWLTEQGGMAARLRDFAAIATSDGRAEMAKQLRGLAHYLETQDENP